ncbi:MAG: ATP-binding protein [Acidimicrobiia bacterium]|nr:ATP-binding protein [Acidimicrobiia bacterium]MCY4456560.1 ATP-binding protein [Acidimicrobiaceae bacterium]
MSLALDSDPAELQRLADAIEEFAEREGWSPDLAFKINLVLEEMVMNVITHGNVDGLAEIQVKVTSSEDSVALQLVDNGVAFDPLTDAPEPEIAGSVQERHIGGLGIHLVRTMMDHISYERAEGRNLLTMTTKKA